MEIMNMRSKRHAFTLVELLVVVAIMALLIGIAIPSLTGARTAAKRTAVQAQIRAIDNGLELFRTEQGLGGRLPPSASDIPDSDTEAGKIKDPHIGQVFPPDPTSTVPENHSRITGASLLVYALSGPDNNGTAGFRPIAGAPWAQTTGGIGTGGIYDTTLDPPAPRYGPYGGAELMDSVGTLHDYIRLSSASSDHLLGDWEKNQRVYFDKFNAPILYYRARTAARFMIYDPGRGRVGIYDHRDNALITGGKIHASGDQSRDGIFSGTKSHLINFTRYLEDPGYLTQGSTSFDAYILDPKSSTVLKDAKPIRADSYLLISAGADGLFGTKDDVTNWKN
jgi:prepilin-type N-terminal cleavage/methylation domain-containing protein